MNRFRIFTNGLLKENPVLVLATGLCPLLAVSVTAINALCMGIATALVLAFSSTTISILRRLTPEQLRLPVSVVVISTFTTIVDLVMSAYFPVLHRALGIFVPLIAVNCIIMNRTEVFAYRNKVLDSMLDGLGMGLGFLFIILIIGSLREISGNGTFFGSSQFISYPAIIMVLPPGAFIALGLLMGLAQWFKNRQAMNRNGKERDKGI